MANKISQLIAKLKRENPSLEDEPLLDEIELAAGGEPSDDAEAPEPEGEEDDLAEPPQDVGGMYPMGEDEAEEPEAEPEMPAPKAGKRKFKAPMF